MLAIKGVAVICLLLAWVVGAETTGGGKDSEIRCSRCFVDDVVSFLFLPVFLVAVAVAVAVAEAVVLLVWVCAYWVFCIVRKRGVGGGGISIGDFGDEEGDRSGTERVFGREAPRTREASRLLL